MAEPQPLLSDEEKVHERTRRTFYLVAGGVLSLLVPLLGLAYMKYAEKRNAQPSYISGGVFAARQETKVIPSATMAAPMAPAPPAGGAPGTNQASGSLGFIRSSQDFAPEPAKAPAPAPAPAPAAPTLAQAAAKAAAPPPGLLKPAPAPAPAKTAAAGPKPFYMPKLKPTGSFKGSGAGGAGQQAPPGFAGKGGAPPAGGMPRLGGQGAPAGGAPGVQQPPTPDVGAMMKAAGADKVMGEVNSNMANAREAQKAVPKDKQVALPDMEGMMKGVPGLDAAGGQK